MLVEVGQPSDGYLIGRVRDGDDHAFAELAGRYRTWLVRVCTGILGDRHLAEDVAQETLVKVHRMITAGNAPDRFRPWLRVVARHACIDEQRRRVPEPVDEVPECMTTCRERERLDPEHLATDGLDLPLATAWDRIHSRHREVLRHRELGGLSYAEIAATMGLSLAAVETLLFRARAALRREYTRAGGTSLPSESLARGLLLVDAGRVEGTAPLVRTFGTHAAHLAAEAAPSIARGAQGGGTLDGWRELAAGVAATVLALGLVAPPRGADPPATDVGFPKVEAGVAPEVDDAPTPPAVPSSPAPEVPDGELEAPDPSGAEAPEPPSDSSPSEAEEEGNRIRARLSSVRAAAVEVTGDAVEQVTEEPRRAVDKILD